MPSSLIILTGAPRTEQLDWSEASLTVQSDERFTAELVSSSETNYSRVDNASKWRAIVLKQNTGTAAGFPTSSQLVSTDPNTTDDNVDDIQQECTNEDELNSQSVAFIDHLETSELSPLKLTPIVNASSQNADQSFYSALTDSGVLDDTSVVTSLSSSQLQELVSTSFTDLQRLPDHVYLQRISPQTVTVDLLVAIIAIRPTKTVQLRRRRAEMDIVELIVGDETRAGFGINVWLTPTNNEPHVTEDLARVTYGLRSGDLVLLKNVGLSHFRSIVHGQTLSRRFTRTFTTMLKIDRSTAASAKEAQKLRRVYEWSIRFVNAAENETARRHSHGRSRNGETELLPPDTPPER